MDRTSPVRILVCGDANVGKTTLIDILCGEYDDVTPKDTHRTLRSSQATVGCYINVREHEMSRLHRASHSSTAHSSSSSTTDHHHPSSQQYRRHNNTNGNDGAFNSATSATSATSSTSSTSTTSTTSATGPTSATVPTSFNPRPTNGNHTHGVEFIEVGGSRQYALSRPVLYSNVHGIVLVHDLTNPKSLYSLCSTWLKELAIADQRRAHFGGISARHQVGEGDLDIALQSTSAHTAHVVHSGKTQDHQRLSAQDLSVAQASLLQKIPVLVVGNKLNSGGSGNSIKYTAYKYEEEVRRVVFATVEETEMGGGSNDPRHKCVVIDAYNEAEEATSYRNGGSRMEHILRFVDAVCLSSSTGCETA